jgi:hypothetical protein
MNIIREALIVATISLVATSSAFGQATAPPGPSAGSGSSPDQERDCVLKTLNACTANAGCTPLDNLKGEKLPFKMTIDLAAGIVAGVNSNGWVDATRIASLARTDDELILQGIDNAVAWQILVYEKNEVMSFSLATADGATIGFGECTAVKEP